MWDEEDDKEQGQDKYEKGSTMRKDENPKP